MRMMHTAKWLALALVPVMAYQVTTYNTTTNEKRLLREFHQLVSWSQTTLTKEHRRNQQHAGDLFTNYCKLIETTGDFQCDCNAATYTARCKTDNICEDKVCAAFHVETDFDSNLQLQSIQICVDYTTNIQASDFRDGCVTLDYSDDGETVNGCVIEFASFYDTMTRCNSCDVCMDGSDRQGFTIDCSNIEKEASTRGCVVIDDDRGGAFFPGFRAAPSGSTCTAILPVLILAFAVTFW